MNIKTIILTLALILGFSFSALAAATPKPTPTPKLGWYWPVQPPTGYGSMFYVGPYGTKAGCQDMYGSAIYSHPWACHLTGPNPPSNCRITGNGFAYPKSYAYPVPTNQVLVGDTSFPGNGGCLQLPITGDNVHAAGLYFIEYKPNASAVVKQGGGRYGAAKKAAADPTTGVMIGNYADAQCPDAPFFTIGSDTACN